MAGISWMPTTWAGKAAMFANVGAKIGNYAAALGLTPAEVLAAVGMCDQFAAQYSFITQTQAYSQAATQWRDLGMSGEPEGDPLGAPPAGQALRKPDREGGRYIQRCVSRPCSRAGFRNVLRTPARLQNRDFPLKD